ncbi:MAG: SDR family NAD(P)-dependent oxidoreductase [Pseudomonadota bacterium]
MFESYPAPFNAVVVGASGGIGSAFTRHLAGSGKVDTIIAYSRAPIGGQGKIETRALDFLDEAVLAAEANYLKDFAPRLILIATGVLHDGAAVQPEKALRQLDIGTMEEVFRINTFGPALTLKHFLPTLPREGKSVAAAISARVGSISDNGLGGWYSYRSSKAALNMMLRTSAIEMSRRWKEAVCVGLHPGTVDTALSKPFQSGVVDKKLFSPDYSAGEMLKVLDSLTPEQTGQVFDYAGKVVPF